MSHDTLTEILAAAPQLAALIILYIWHREDSVIRSQEHTLTIKTLATLSRQSLQLTQHKSEEQHG